MNRSLLLNEIYIGEAKTFEKVLRFCISTYVYLNLIDLDELMN